jgi:protein SCO1
MKRVSKRFPQKKASRQLIYIVIGFAVALAGLGGLIYGVMPTQKGLGSPLGGEPFIMIRHDGRMMTNTDLAGHPYLVFFGYTHCPDVCPTTLSDISAAFKELGPDKKIAALFVTVDPERDTPDVLKAYLEHFDSRVIGLTGDQQRTAAIAKAFRVYAKKVTDEGTGDYTVDHSGVVYLMDKRGRFVSAFNLQGTPKEAARELERYL